ncbi:uroporphyrinogen decarboxylase family protein [Marispirochaeta sp.]|uniref:uroporphyrinogen decarboxylase family protein n=1 Tax=Marispirochaeta sp. TaxID=2038653 RepID=UPI0029C6C1CD|nr:uroporphyrinogen decarboxylase family protein [Marispirochaeta sp.]
MNSRERVKAAIAWNRPDRIPVHENFWTDTLTVWKKKGMPEYITMYPPESVEDFFDLDIAPMYLDSSPRFRQKIISKDDDYYTYEDRWGYTATKPWQASGSIHYEKTVTENKEVWEKEVKPRMVLDPNDTARIDDASYFEHFDEYPSWESALGKIRSLHENHKYILAFNYGPWEATWRHRDFTNCLMDVALDPEWIKDMMWTHHELTKNIIRKSYNTGIVPDGYIMVDDLGSSTTTLISPDMFRDILKPVYKDMGEFLESLEIDFWLHSCGNVNLLIDDYIDVGIQVLNPVQVSAGMNAIEIAKKYKNQIAFYGNLDTHVLTSDWETLKTALEERCIYFRNGGWISHSDHSIPPNMPYENFIKMIDFVKNYESLE